MNSIRKKLKNSKMRSTPEKMLPNWSRIVRKYRSNNKNKKEFSFRVFSKNYSAN